MSTTSQLNRWMRYEKTYRGAFPLDWIPHLPLRHRGHCFIVNTHTANLPGQHWIAVRIVHDQAWIFDPLSSLSPPPRLCQHLLTHCHMRVLNVNIESVQPPLSQTCGLHCVYFLYTHEPAPSESAVFAFINKLDE